jgi:hypothetical protein
VDQPIDLTKAQLFLDDTWIEEATYVSRQWHQPRRLPEPVLKPEHAWERWCPTMYGTVLHWRGKFRMWYIPFGYSGSRQMLSTRTGVCYAESFDGAAWEKPALGLCDYEGNRDNNIVVEAAGPGRYIDNISIIDDPEDSEWPLKALYWEAATHDWSKHDWGIFAARSKDGIHWDRSPGLVLPQWIDRFNAVSTKLNGQYGVYGRGSDVQRTMGRNGRSVWRTASSDLRQWSDAELVLERDTEDPVYMQYYSLSAFPYESVMLGGLERMHMSPDHLDTEIVWSHDGGHKWLRSRTRPAFLAPRAEAPHWDGAWVNLPSNAPIVQQGRLWFFYTGRSHGHDAPYPLNYGSIGLALLRIDGFASLHAAETEGRIVTKALTWPGGELHLNADPRRSLATHPGFCSGEVRAEVRDEQNQPLAGFTWDDATPITGNTHAAPHSRARVEWRDGKSMQELTGRRIRLAFKLRDAHLYSFCAASDSS